jgi:hypothetical protein
MHLSCFPYVLHAPSILFFLIFRPNKIWWGVQIIKLLVTSYCPLPPEPRPS